MVSFRYHGNYVGPGWSAGKYQTSVRRSKVRPVDEFDATAQEHDAAYATPGSNLKKADYKFYRQNIGKGLKRSVAAVAVGAQGLLRSSSQNEKNNDMPRSRSRSPRTPTPRGRVLVPETPSTERTIRRQVRIQARRMQLQKSPGFMRGGKKKSAKTYGSTQSKSAGFFPKGSKKKNPLDSFAKKGCVLVSELGAIDTGSAAAKVQAFAIGHATSSINSTLYGIALAMIKAIFVRAGHDIKSFDGTILPIFNSREMEMELQWVVGVSSLGTSPPTEYSTYQILRNSTTYAQLAASVETNLRTVCQAGKQIHFRSLKIQYKNVGDPLVGGVGSEEVARIDLSKAKVSIYAKSSMKIQNRTVNSSGNDEADDVDNVPLYGKSYTGNGNGFRIQDQFIVPKANAFGVGYISEGFLSPNALSEPALKSQVKGCTLIGKAHLDPGQIKTSVLTFSKTMYLDTLFQILNIGVIANSDQYTLKLGKVRVFHLEKMIQSVATTDVNAIKIAWEIDLKQGFSMTAPKFVTTSQVVTLNPL